MPLPGYRILIVDDEALIALDLTQVLQQLQAVVVGSGHDDRGRRVKTGSASLPPPAVPRSGDAASNPHPDSWRSPRAWLWHERHLREVPASCRPGYAGVDGETWRGLPLHPPGLERLSGLGTMWVAGDWSADPLSPFRSLPVRMIRSLSPCRRRPTLCARCGATTETLTPRPAGAQLAVLELA